MSLEQEIKAWDQKSSDDIRAIYLKYSQQTSFIPEILRLSKLSLTQKGASWLLLHNLKSEHKLNEGQNRVFWCLLSSLEHWEAKLHILQCFEYLTIEHSHKRQVEQFLRNCLTDGNKFVRAWAYNGFYLLSEQYSEYREETKSFLNLAMKDESPSVKARIRNITKKIT